MQLLRNPQAGCKCSVQRTNSHRAVLCKAAVVQQNAACSTNSRRDALLQAAILASGLAFGGKAQAVCADLDTAEAGDACRQAELANDEGKNYKGNYNSLTSGPAKKTAANVPVSSLGQQYVTETRALADTIQTYITIDVYDKKRQGLIKQMKTDALSWVSKYARGGSVRAQSARQMYIAADAVLGHLASNGLAPLPTNKAKTVKQVMSEGLAFLDEGR